MSETPSLVRLEIASPVAEIILHRPEKRNALSIEMWRAIPSLIEQASSNEDVKVLIIHGGDAGAFAAGADISEFSKIYATPEDARASGQIIADALNAVEHCPKPTLAAIEGACVGGGVSLAMACDMRVASSEGRFAITPAKLGLVYPAGDTRRLLQAIGPSATKRLLYTGKIISAEEALSLRLIDETTPPGHALEAAHSLAREISSTSQWSTRAIKQMIRGIEGGWTDTTPDATQLFVDGFSNPDFQDGHAAFLEKRPPKFPFK